MNDPAAGTPQPGGAIRVSPVNQYERVVVTLTELLGRAPTAFELMPAISFDEPSRATPVDVAVYDTFGSTDARADVASLCERVDVAHVIVLAAEADPDLAATLVGAGADAVVSKLQPPADLFRSILQVGSHDANRRSS